MDIRFKQPFRRWLLGLSYHLPKGWQEGFLNWMYPDNAVIHFKGD